MSRTFRALSTDWFIVDYRGETRTIVVELMAWLLVQLVSSPNIYIKLNEADSISPQDQHLFTSQLPMVTPTSSQYSFPTEREQEHPKSTVSLPKCWQLKKDIRKQLLCYAPGLRTSRKHRTRRQLLARKSTGSECIHRDRLTNSLSKYLSSISLPCTFQIHLLPIYLLPHLKLRRALSILVEVLLRASSMTPRRHVAQVFLQFSRKPLILARL